MNERTASYVSVAVPLALSNSTLSYSLANEHLSDGRSPEDCVGCRVHVKVRQKSLIGLILQVLPNADIDPQRIRPIEALLDKSPAIKPETINFLVDVSRYYRQSVGLISQLALPRDSLSFTATYSLKTKISQHDRGGRTLFDLNDAVRGALEGSPEPLDIHSLRNALVDIGIKDGSKPTLKEIRGIVDALCAQGIVEKKRACKTSLPGMKPRRDQSAIDTPESLIAPIRPSSPATEKRPRRSSTIVRVRSPDYRLNEHQRKAARQIIGGLDDFGVFLVHGVTGSGKTDVYLRAIAAALNSPGKHNKDHDDAPQVLVLVPEISLAPQWQERISAYLSTRAAISHYKIGDSVRARVWAEASQGTARVLIGARSTVFMPFARLRLIIVDEEHSHLYKERDTGGYHARDVAIWRAQRLGIPVVLGSATPSGATWHNLDKSHYRVLRLPQRIEGIGLPRVNMIDLAKEKVYSGFSQSLLDKMREVLEGSRQVMIYHNSRGYAPALYCAVCARVVPCRNCRSAMHVHKGHSNRGGDYLLCHRCLTRTSLKQGCPDCGGTELTPVGMSTQQIEQVINSKFPEYNSMRMDSDNISTNAKLKSALQRIHEGQAQILIGTQMLVKGHHFSNVGLVAVLQPDVHLFSSDLFARERLLQDLVQVAGRSGRERTGEVIIQTRFPAEKLYQYVCRHDYLAAMKAILHERQATAMPPYRFLTIFRFSDSRRERLMAQVEDLSRLMKNEGLGDVEFFAPVLPIISYSHRRYRVQAWLTAASRGALSLAIDKFSSLCQQANVPSWSIDIDPISAE